jgi:limonene 1,2-monooxygenase
MIASGLAVIGTPDDAIAQIERLKRQSGGFGAFLQMAHNWADFEATKRSYEMMARYVFPRFQGSSTNRDASLDWARTNRERFMGEARMAVGTRIAQHIQERGVDNIAPEILAAMSAAQGAAE